MMCGSGRSPDSRDFIMGSSQVTASAMTLLVVGVRQTQFLSRETGGSGLEHWRVGSRSLRMGGEDSTALGKDFLPVRFAGLRNMEPLLRLQSPTMASSSEADPSSPKYHPSRM